MEKNNKKKISTNCEDCLYYIYDEDYDTYSCTMYLDEDEMLRFMSGKYENCPYYHNGDEYITVRKQN